MVCQVNLQLRVIGNVGNVERSTGWGIGGICGCVAKISGDRC